MTSSNKISVIGLGKMGAAIAAELLKKGYQVTVWNRSAEKADELITHGAALAPTAKDAMEASPLVIVCLLNYDIAYKVLESAPSDLSGKTLVNLTNGTPEEARKLATWAAEHKSSYLDGGIMAIPAMIGQPEALILYSGSKDAYQVHREILETLGSSDYLGVDSGLAPLYDLALLSGMYGMFSGFLQAIALLGTEVEAAKFTSTRFIPWIEAMLTSLPEMAKQIDTGKYVTEGSNLGMQAISLKNILEASKSRDVDSHLIAPLYTMAAQRVADGHANDDISGLIEIIRNQQYDAS